MENHGYRTYQETMGVPHQEKEFHVNAKFSSSCEVKSIHVLWNGPNIQVAPCLTHVLLKSALLVLKANKQLH
jgi:hypothetical protein